MSTDLPRWFAAAEAAARAFRSAAHFRTLAETVVYRDPANRAKDLARAVAAQADAARLSRTARRLAGVEPPTIGFYVTVQRDAFPKPRVAWLRGPFATHEEALAAVDETWLAACEIDPKMSFDARGTARLALDRPLADFPPGTMNSHFSA